MDETSFLDSFCCIAEQLNGYAQLKDISSASIYLNKNACALLGFKSQEAAQGAMDYDIPYGELAEHAETFVWQDKQAKKKGSLESLEILHYTDGVNVMWSNKRPLQDLSGKSIGVFVHSVPMKNTLLSAIGKLIFQRDLVYNGVGSRASHYVLQDHSNSEISKLPRRTDECLFYMLRGKSAGEIAKYMQLSVRTIEGYFDILKAHFNCTKKSQLIEKAINHGYLTIFPKKIIQRELMDFL